MNYKKAFLSFMLAWCSISIAAEITKTAEINLSDFTHTDTLAKLEDLIVGDVFIIGHLAKKGEPAAKQLSIATETVCVSVWITSPDSENWVCHKHPKINNTLPLNYLPVAWLASKADPSKQKSDGSFIQFPYEGKTILLRLNQDAYRYKGQRANLDPNRPKSQGGLLD